MTGVRAVFAAYLFVIVAGLAYCTLAGVQARRRGPLGHRGDGLIHDQGAGRPEGLA